MNFPYYCNTIYLITISVAGPKIWNSIATNNQNMSPVMFKQNVKAVLNGAIVVNKSTLMPMK